MKRLWPKSLLGQVLLAVALALLVAQSISAVLLYRAGENRREQAALNAAAFRLVTANRTGQIENREGSNAEPSELRRSQRRANRRAERQRLRDKASPVRLPRTLRVETADGFNRQSNERLHPSLQEELTTILEREGVNVSEVRVTKRKALQDSYIRERPGVLRRISQPENAGSMLLVAGLRTAERDDWQIARVILPPRQSGALGTIVLQTLLIYLLLVGLHFLLLRRITRPLAKLTARTESFGGVGEAEPLAEEGPDDVRKLVAAHNTMETRIAALLDEKDVMLGAIGHDLKTPLAALRVRIEAVDDNHQRNKMAASIEDISQSLDDILSLARVGRAKTPPEKTELSALVASVVDEFEDMGKPVTFTGNERLTQRVHVTWLRRALRNLISNALRYAGTAEVSLARLDGGVTLAVDDNGPGIPEESITAMLEPFTRGEASRNRATGGAGLGLTLARAIAEQHGGRLVLSNRSEGGLRAEIHLPANNST